MPPGTQQEWCLSSLVSAATLEGGSKASPFTEEHTEAGQSDVP